VSPPDPAWHFSGRSQSAAWTALNGPYRDAVLDDRSDEAAEIMATEIAPDFEYVGRTSGGFQLHAHWRPSDFASSGAERAIVGLEDWIPLEPMLGGFDGIDHSIVLDSDLHPPRIGERRRMRPSGRLPYGVVLEGMAPGQPTRFKFTDPGQGFDLERRADGWHVVGRQRAGYTRVTLRPGGVESIPVRPLAVAAVDSPRGTITLEAQGEPFFGVSRNAGGSALLAGIEARRGVPYRPRWASRLAATLAEGLSA
jgi:hypothetical protein